MSFPKVLAVTALLLFSSIAVIAFFKKESTTVTAKEPSRRTAGPVEVRLDEDVKILAPAPAPKKIVPKIVAAVEPSKKSESKPQAKSELTPESEELPSANRVAELFNKGDPKLPFVETITYKSRVAWLKGRPAWLSDYANHHETSRHFIARSLNGKPDYFKQDLAEGDRFNVFSKEKEIEFHLLIDTSRCKMWLYAIDKEPNDRYLLKTYRVGLGRPDSSRTSGLLTPLGKYTLGNKIAIYKPKMMGHHNGEKVEMITVFGTRWIPFDKEVSNCTAPAKGFGIHGVPVINGDKGRVEDISSIGQYMSDGCVRMATEDIEEIFAIIITKPTVVEIVKDFYEAKLPGAEKGG